MWTVRELYGNDREKERFTGFSSIVPHKVSCLSFCQQHHAVASPIDQASTKKSPTYQDKYIVIQPYSLFTFCLRRLDIVWPLWPSFFIASAIDVSHKPGLLGQVRVKVFIWLLRSASYTLLWETNPSFLFFTFKLCKSITGWPGSHVAINDNDEEPQGII